MCIDLDTYITQPEEVLDLNKIMIAEENYVQWTSSDPSAYVSTKQASTTFCARYESTIIKGLAINFHLQKEECKFFTTYTAALW